MLRHLTVNSWGVLLGLTILTTLCTNILAAEGNWTSKHEAGRCAIRGQCGKKSFFGGELPCPDNGLAEDPDQDTRKKLVAICGDSWSEGDVCCDSDQVGIIAGLGRSSVNCMPDRQLELESQTRRINHLVLSCMQGKFLQPLLHIHLLTRSIALRQCYSVTKGFHRETHSD